MNWSYFSPKGLRAPKALRGHGREPVGFHQEQDLLGKICSLVVKAGEIKAGLMVYMSDGKKPSRFRAVITYLFVVQSFADNTIRKYSIHVTLTDF